MATDLNKALSAFEAVEANLTKLNDLWAQLAELLPLPNSNVIGITNDAEYRRLIRAFRNIATAMPKIDGFQLNCTILEPDELTTLHLETREVDEFSCTINFCEQLNQPAVQLQEYRFRLGLKRRELARQSIRQLCREMGEGLRKLGRSTAKLDANEKLPEEAWERLHQFAKSIDTLIGGQIKRPAAWEDLMRHFAFGQRCDYEDIIKRDWPTVSSWLDTALYGDEEPIPTAVGDIGELVASNPSGPIATELNWSILTDENFERLIYNLVSHTPGYENPEWLTHTNAPDKGRDISVLRVQSDVLTGSRRMRVIIQCKHSKSVGIGDITQVKEQMALWEPPRVDELIVVTSGRFSSDAVQWIEKHNQSNSSLRIEMWSNSHLERLLAERPHFIAEFRLRKSSGD